MVRERLGDAFKRETVDWVAQMSYTCGMNNQQLTVFLEYTRRFEQIAADLPAEVREAPAGFDRKYLETKERRSSKVQHAVIRYFNLCSEEFYLHGEKLIPEDIWTYWTSQMRSTASSPLFAEAWRRVRSQYEGQEAFQRFMDGLTAEV